MNFEEFQKRLKQKENVLNVTITDDTSKENIIYNVKNETSLWRAQTLFTKEPHTISWIRGFKKGSIFFDVGANVGMYSIFSAVISKVKVFAFEPESNNFQILMENIISNKLTDIIKPFPIAVGDKSALTTLYLSEFRIGKSHHMIDKELDHNLKETTYKISQGVFKTSLDELITKWKFPIPNYLKIDVDGVESLIINNGRSLLKEKQLQSVSIEINRNREEDLEIISIFQKSNFNYDNSQVDKATRKTGKHQGYAEYIFYK